MNSVLVVLAVIAITVEVNGSAEQRRIWFGKKMDAVGDSEGTLSPSITKRILNHAKLNKLFKDDSDVHGAENDSELDSRLDNAESNVRKDKKHVAMLKIKDELRKYTNDHKDVIDGYKRTARCLRKYNEHEGSSRDTNTRKGKSYNCGDFIYLNRPEEKLVATIIPCGGSASQVRYKRLDYFDDMGITATLIVNWMNELPNKPGTARPSYTASSDTGIGKTLYGADSMRDGYELGCHFVLTGIKKDK